MKSLIISVICLSLQFSATIALAEERLVEFQVGLPENWVTANYIKGTMGVAPGTHSIDLPERSVTVREATEGKSNLWIAEVGQEDGRDGKPYPVIASCTFHWEPPYTADVLNGVIVIVAKVECSLRITVPANAVLDINGNETALKEPIAIKPGRLELRLHARRTR